MNNWGKYNLYHCPCVHATGIGKPLSCLVMGSAIVHTDGDA